MLMPSIVCLRKLFPFVVWDVKKLDSLVRVTSARDDEVVRVGSVSADAMVTPWVAHIWLSDALELFIVIHYKLCALSRLLIATEDVNRNTNLDPSVIESDKFRVSHTVLGQLSCLKIK